MSQLDPDVQREVDRVVTRFMVERDAAGWTNWYLGKEGGFHYTNLDAIERGDARPSLYLMIQAGLVMGLRLDWVPAHIRPLLELDEFEVAELLSAATQGWTLTQTGSRRDEVLTRVLQKLGRLTGAPEA